MFTWNHEFSFEVDIPIQRVWEFNANLDNWPKWLDEFEYFEGEFKTGSTITGLIKKYNVKASILITGVKPPYVEEVLIKKFPFTQIRTTTYREISPNRTQIVAKTSVKSILTPFMKSYYRRKVEKTFPKLVKALLENG